MIESDCAVGGGGCAEVLKVILNLVGEFVSEPLVKADDVRNFFHNLHSDCAAQKLRNRFLGGFDFDDPGCFSALVGGETEIRHEPRD